MDKNKIKSFAIWARRNLISAVSERANRIGVTENKILDAVAVQGGFKLEGNDEIFKLSKDHRDKLVKEVNEKGFEQVMEEVAYTWFNRFMGLRYMEVNEYLPTGVRVLSSEVQGKTEPDVLTRVSEVIDELNLNSEYIYELLDSGKTEDREEAYKHILVRQCNELGKIIPQMFEKISDYTELLLPDNLLEEGSVIRKMVEGIEEDDWKEEVEIIGWMYQYYISEKKDEVFAALKNNVKITKENIPAATQLFTPKWIVKYMVENSLGRLWLEGHPNEELKKEWKYYLEEAQQEPEVEEELKKIREEHSKLKPEDIKVLDPCMGSGHTLTYTFDLLYQIYKTAGYSEREIPRMILQNNLYGLDIDDRAAQLASFALIMKARHYNRRLFREMERESLELSLCSIQESNSIHKEAIDYFCSLETGLDNDELENDFEYLWSTFNDAKEYGSILEVEKVNFEALKQRLKEIEQEDNLMFGDYRKMLLDKLPMMIKQAEVMSRKYEVCVTNPPYMGRRGMNNNLVKYVDNKFMNSKNDMFTIFIDVCIRYCEYKKYIGMINQQTWMFLPTYELLREDIIRNYTVTNMLQLGTRTFDEIGGEVVQSTTFILQRFNYKEMLYSSIFIDLKKGQNSTSKNEMLLNKDNGEYSNIQYNFKLKDILNIPMKPFVYWLNSKVIDILNVSDRLEEKAFPKTGFTTGDNEKFLRLWHEISADDFSGTENKGVKWIPLNKGGSFRKWYGNREYCVEWNENGGNIKAFKGSTIRNEDYYFKEGVTWSKISSGTFAGRYSPKDTLFDAVGLTCFPSEKVSLNYILAYFCSKVGDYFAQLLNPTLTYTVGTISKFPMIIKENDKINDIVTKAIYISKKDWDLFETSWDFKVHPLLKSLIKADDCKLSSAFKVWEDESEANFNELKANEEELNRIFIDIYGLQDELTPEVEDKDVTIRKADRGRDVKSFISYAVGCMFGRYSIDAEGLIYAGGDFNDKWNLDDNGCKVKTYINIPEIDAGTIREYKKNEDGNLIDVERECKMETQKEEVWLEATFIPDVDNVIPITEDEYFEDDIVARFIEFVRTVYSVETLEENLDFIADSIGRKPSETARQAIRRYFIKDFYKDHLKVYQKRPIYWMFESGKNDGFKALVYMHRYNEQTVARVRTDYLHTLQRKYEAEIQRQQLIVDSEEYTAKDRTAAKKKIDRISKQIEECREYDQVVAHLANEKIYIDLDDGVKVNYEKFQGVKVINSKDKEVKMDLLANI